MSRVRAVAALATALILISLADRPRAIQQTPTRDVRTLAPAPTGTAAVAGVVTTADGSARPLRLAHVVLIGSATGTLRVTSTDGDGRFSFADLPADRYVIGASKPPYLGAVAGARRPARPGTPVAVREGESVANIAIRLPMAAAVAGVITDEGGQPIPGVLVGLQRTRGGERVSVTSPGGLVGTDERGRYRLFGLPPGEYFVVAMRLGTLGAAPLSDADVDAAMKGGRVALPPGDPLSRYAPVFFPGTTRADDAAPVVLSAGEERDGVDFRVQSVRTARLEGIVMTADGQPTPAADVMLSPAISSPLQFTSRMRVTPDGRFATTNLPPGSYTIVAQAGGGPGGLSAAIPLVIDGADLTGIQVTLRPPLTLSGRLVFDGAAPPAVLNGRRVPLRVLTPGLTGVAAPQVAPTGADGSFLISRVLPGRYLLGGPLFFGATTDSVTWALQSVIVDGRDVTDLPFEITSDAPPKEIVVTYGDRWQQLSGRLLQSSGALAPDYTIVVFPANRAYWISRSRRIVTTRPGTDGQFTVSGPGPITLPPGDYLVAAVTDIDRDEQFDPAFLSSLVTAAIPVTLHAGDRKVQDLIIK
jgi:hypothetical protein